MGRLMPGASGKSPDRCLLSHSCWIQWSATALHAGTARGGFKPPRVRGAGVSGPSSGGGAGGGAAGEDGEGAESPYSANTLQLLAGMQQQV